MENISKIVLTLDGRIIGYILDVAFDELTLKKIGYYVVDEETEGELFLKLEDVVSISDVAVIVKDVLSFEFVQKRENSLIGKLVFDDKANCYGSVQKLCFNKSKCEKICTTQCEILTKYIKTIGKDFVLLQFSKKKKQKHKDAFLDINKKLPNDNVVEIQNKAVVVSKPEKINLSTAFYVGKMSNEDILGYNNERIVSKGEIVSKAIVEKAKKHNKLNQLFFALKR